MCITMWTTYGQPMDNVWSVKTPRTASVRVRTHKKNSSRELALLPSLIVGIECPRFMSHDGCLGCEITGPAELRSGPQGGPWWTAVDAAIDRQEEAQLLNRKQGAPQTSSQRPLFSPTPYPPKP